MATTNRVTRKKPKPFKPKSGFEDKVAKALGLSDAYETKGFAFVSKHKYTPDFEVASDVFIECKGYFKPSDRSKMLLARDQNAGVTFFLYFMNAGTKIHKKSETTYGDWCDKHSFPWACLKTKPLAKGDLKLMKAMYSNESSQ